MSKKYDYNLQEIKETGTVATNTTYDSGFTCDVCGRKTQGTTIVNGMQFCAKCHQDTFGNNQITELKQQLVEKDKEIERLKEDNNWYSMWHKKFQKEIEDLKTELETYRPTHLKGNGQCQCAICKQMNWTDWCIKYDGKTYCDTCFKQVETRDDKLRHQACEEIFDIIDKKYNALGYIEDMKFEDLKNYVLDQLEKRRER